MRRVHAPRTSVSLDHPRCQQRGQKHRQKGLHREGEVVKAAERVKEGSRERVEGLLAACARETCYEGHRNGNTDTNVGVGGKEREWEARSPWYFKIFYLLLSVAEQWPRTSGPRARSKNGNNGCLHVLGILQSILLSASILALRGLCLAAVLTMRGLWDNDERSSRTMEEV